jgi:hypothetical protein
MNNSPLTLVALLSLGLGTTLSAGPGPRQFAPELTSQVDEIRAGLQRKGATYEVDVNPAMQYSLDQICGLKPELRPYDFQAHAEGGYLNNQTEDLTAVTLPSRYVGWFSSVKDQGQCGSCWAFATIGTLEGAALKKRGYPQGRVNADGSITTSGDVTVLSEQQVLSCNPEGYGCQGGWYAFDMLMPTNATQGQGYYKGAIPARVFPYVAKEVACSFNTSTSYTPVSSWGYVGNGYSTPSTASIKAAIYRYGGVIAGVYADQNFQAYRRGVFSGSDNYSQPNHAILLVGWDDSKGAWLLKNSWSAQWGTNGFMWIKYGVNHVGVSPAWALD